MPHDFYASLALSHAAADLPLWGEVYREFFPDMVGMFDHRANGEHQAAGIDRSILMPNSKQFLVDEKVRFRNRLTGRVYADVALEYLSDSRRRTPGWVCRPLRADYIAYAIAPLGICYVLPVPALQRAWQVNGDSWLLAYPRVVAHNETGGRSWDTYSVAVPAPVLYRALGNMHRVYFTASEDFPSTQGLAP